MGFSPELQQAIKDKYFPESVEVVGRGRPKFAVFYDRWPGSKKGCTRYDRNDDAVNACIEAIHAMSNGTSFRQAATYVSDRAGKKVSHEIMRRAYNEVSQDYPEWEKNRTSAHKMNDKKTNPISLEADPEKQQKLIKKSMLKRKLTEMSKEYAYLTAEDKVKKGEVPKEALQQPEKVLNEDLSPKTPKQLKEEKQEEEAQEAQKVVFKPNPGPQTDFLAAPEREVLYGGAAGGGKSYALIADPVRYFGNKNFNGILLRRTNDELRELIWKTQEMYPAIYKGAKWSERKSQWTFPSGAKLWMTFLDRDEDVLRYQGQAFSWIGFDELTQHPTPFAWDYMRSRLRTTDPSLPLCMRATTNPGGPGHGWVKKMFIDPAPPNTKYCATSLETNQELRYPEGHEKEGQPLFFRRFIPATLKDNPYLTADGQYEANLLSLNDSQRRQLLDGDWSLAEGAAFPEFHATVHTCEPFDIPHDWKRFRSCDFGYTTYSAVHWFAIDPSYETLYVYRELYVSKNTAKELARKVMELEEGERIAYGVLDSSTWHKRGHTGPSIAEEMLMEGCRWRPSDRTAGSRVAGKNRLHELLKVEEDIEKPSIIFFNTCRQIISDMQVIPSCPKGTDDIDVRYTSDHAYDSIRYGIMSRPRSSSPFDFNDGLAKTAWTPMDPVFGY